MSMPTSQTIDQVTMRSKTYMESDREAIAHAAERHECNQCNQVSWRLNEAFMLIKHWLVFVRGSHDCQSILCGTSSSTMTIAQYDTLDLMYKALIVTYMYKALMVIYKARTVVCKALIRHIWGTNCNCNRMLKNDFNHQQFTCRHTNLMS